MEQIESASNTTVDSHPPFTLGDESGELPLGVEQLIDAGVHFGHQTKRWNPKMRPYIYGARNGIHIIDLDKTADHFRRAYLFIREAVARCGEVLFVGTKRQAAEIIVEEAKRADQFYVSGRWLGGTLTNFRTVKTGIDRLRELESMAEDGSLNNLLKKEALQLDRERQRLESYLGGIKHMNRLPAAIFIVDPQHEHIAIREGRKLAIPIVAITDTNCDPGSVDYLIPGNDDAIRSIRLIVSRIADACLEGKQRRTSYGQESVETGDQSSVQVEFTRTRRPLRPVVHYGGPDYIPEDDLEEEDPKQAAKRAAAAQLAGQPAQAPTEEAEQTAEPSSEPSDPSPKQS